MIYRENIHTICNHKIKVILGETLGGATTPLCAYYIRLCCFPCGMQLESLRGVHLNLHHAFEIAGEPEAINGWSHRYFCQLQTEIKPTRSYTSWEKNGRMFGEDTSCHHPSLRLVAEADQILSYPYRDDIIAFYACDACVSHWVLVEKPPIKKQRSFFDFALRFK
jgi:hypothetical protein